MRIVQLLPELNEGGVERGVVDLNREFIKKGIENIVISNGGILVDQILKDGGKHIQHDICSKNIFTVPLRVFRLRKILKKINPDIIHVRSRVPAWLVYFANRSLKFKVVSTVHGFNSVNFYSKIMTMGDHVICVSGAIKSYVQEHYHTADEKITIISRGIDLVKFNPENIDKDFIKQFSKQYGLEGRFVVSVVGRITQLKDHQTFIRAIALLKHENPTIAGLIVGGAHEDKQGYFDGLKKLVGQLGADENIIFTGSQDKVAEIYTLSDVVVSSSKKPESFGRSVAEALALNTPVVATAHGGVLDIIIEGGNGFFYPVGDAYGLAEKIMACRTLKFDGYDYVSKFFSLKQMVEKTLAVYKDKL
ncbi:MAG TPA: glycosyl transferase [Sulfurovum sp. UBA12169]|nr:MAG TPA: glycosyl transferase [Sulfurovum sp. UBA12169]